MGLREIAYQAISGWIATGSLAKGSVTSEVELSGRLGMSRTPVRAALQQLETEGYVRIVPKHGVLILDMSAERASDLLELAAALSLYAAEHVRLLYPAELAAFAAERRCVYDRLLTQLQGGAGHDIEALCKFEYGLLEDLLMLLRNKEMSRLMERTLFKLFWLRNKFRWQSSVYSETADILGALLDGMAEPASFSPAVLFNYFGLLKRTWE